MKFFKLSIFISFIIFSFACNEINNPLKDWQEGTCGDKNSPVPIRKILVEDYTGHRCPNCPDAARILDGIHNDYCDHIIPIAVHVSFFAEPHDPDFPEDFRTKTGNELNDFYGVSNQGLPGGLINRKEFNGNLVLGKDNWRSAVDAIYNITPDVNIIIESTYNADAKSITANIRAEFLNAVTESLNLGLYLTEDSIIAPQQDGSEYVKKYLHKHMLRRGINGPFGEKILNSAEKNEVFEKTFTFAADPGWNIAHCELVAFISKHSTNEILQAESEPINNSN
ncbi:MAG: Omp28 family outer membrane lipoprotein [Bacteroidales bacterium]|nr:Omp28 family outer membrane lipoprotein [Bacteroidales bacterium]